MDGTDAGGRVERASDALDARALGAGQTMRAQPDADAHVPAVRPRVPASSRPLHSAPACSSLPSSAPCEVVLGPAGYIRSASGSPPCDGGAPELGNRRRPTSQEKER